MKGLLLYPTTPRRRRLRPQHLGTKNVTRVDYVKGRTFIKVGLYTPYICYKPRSQYNVRYTKYEKYRDKEVAVLEVEITVELNKSQGMVIKRVSRWWSKLFTEKQGHR